MSCDGQRGVHLPDHLQALRVGDSACRGWPGLRGVVGARGDLHPGLAQDGADRLGPEPRPVLVDVVDQHRCGHFSLRSSSAAAKNAEAVRKDNYGVYGVRKRRTSSSTGVATVSLGAPCTG